MIKYETDSRLVTKGKTFVAIKGYTVDGHDYINQAIENGATFIISEKDLDITVPYLKVKDTEKYIEQKLEEEYSSNFKDLKIIGVTGTNGKTTTCYLIYQMLKELNKKAAYIGTIGFYLNDEIRELPNTTPDILSLYKLIMEAKEKEVEYIIMEVSSHALSLSRIAGINFDVAAFTNLSQDHLDFHKDMIDYLNAKKLIINHLKQKGTLIVNLDEETSKEFIFKNKLTIGKNGDYKITNYNYNPDSTDLEFTFKNNTYKVKTNLINEFNIYNYLMSLAILNNLDIPIENIIKITNKVYPPRGRCETIKVNDSYAVIDYAHTPDAVEKIIKAYKELNLGQIITILGCGGDRDRTKRPIMGKIATTYSDKVIFTEDNPRTEDTNQIMNDIIKDNKDTNYEVIFNREDAIKKGLTMINKDDFLLILGKGHEEYQIIGKEKIYFSDLETVIKYSQK